MSFKAEIGIIGAMEPEVEALIASLSEPKVQEVGGIKFNTGTLGGKRVVVARCGIGKVFAAMCAEAMIVKFSPELLINTGVGGATDKSLCALDVVFADRLLQYDMDTSAFGDPVGLISGINKVYFDADPRAVDILSWAAEELGVRFKIGTVATADRFVASVDEKLSLNDAYGASACEMEGGAVAHVAYVNGIPFAVIRAISDSVSDNSPMDYSEFLKSAADISSRLTAKLIEKW